MKKKKNNKLQSRNKNSGKDDKMAKEVVKHELSELKEEIGEKRQIYLRNEDKVGRTSRENRH